MSAKIRQLTPHALSVLAMFTISVLYARAAPDFSPAASAVETVSS